MAYYLPRCMATGFVCYVCGKPVTLEQARTDGQGRVLHSGCLPGKLATDGSDSNPSSIRSR